MDEYARFHQDRTNMLIHIVMVPLFVAGIVVSAWSLLRGEWIIAVLALPLPMISIAVQGAGHKKEPNPTLPFDGPVDFVKRVFSEQFYKFPKFVLSGNWYRVVRASR